MKFRTARTAILMATAFAGIALGTAANAAPESPGRPPVNENSQQELREAAVGATPGGADKSAAGYQQDFINVAGPAAQEVMREFGVPASVGVAQSILESNWGRSGLSVNDKNYFGFKCVSPGNPGPIAIGCHKYVTQECTPTCHNVEAYFRVYASMTQSFRDYGRLLVSNPVYAPAFRHVHNPDQFAREIARHYATDPNYANKVIGLMQTWNLYGFNTAQPASGPMFHQVRGVGGEAWSGFQPLAGYGTAEPGDARDMSIAAMPDGSAQVLIVGADGRVYHQVRDVAGSWSGFQPLAGMDTTDPAGGSRVSITGMPDGSAQVLIVGADGKVYHQVRDLDGRWTGFRPVAGMGSADPAGGKDVAITGMPDGSAQVLIIGADGKVYHQVRAANGSWTGFQPVAGMNTTDPAGGSRVSITGMPDGSAQVLIVGADGKVYHQIREVNGGWTGFRPLAGVGTPDPAGGKDVAITGTPDGSAQVLIIGADDRVYHQVREATGGWNGFQPVAGMGTADPAAGSQVSIAGMPDNTAQITIVGRR